MPERPVAPVLRSLQVLEALNRKAASGLGDLRAATGLPKPTLVRLLNTLIAAGYAARISPAEGYRVTGQVLALAGGLRFIDRIVDAAVPLMAAFTREHGWPLALTKVRDGASLVLHSTVPQSPLSFERAGYNTRSALATGAVGQAHMAFCPAEERQRLIDIVQAGSKIGLAALPDARAIEAHLAAVRRRGYAVTLSPRPAKVFGVAVPVRQGRNVLASLVMRVLRSAMTPEAAAERYLGALNATARAIVAALAEADRAA